MTKETRLGTAYILTVAKKKKKKKRPTQVTKETQLGTAYILTVAKLASGVTVDLVYGDVQIFNLGYRRMV